MRSTFEARGYTVWDPSSPIFIMEEPNGKTLCIPAVFISYYGHALDQKAPLLRSMEILEHQSFGGAETFRQQCVTGLWRRLAPSKSIS